MTSTRRRGGGARLAALPGLALALVPKVTCPACWPAYGSVLTSLGLGFLLRGRWLFATTALFLTLAVAALGASARRRQGLGPFLVGLGASAVVLGGKFGLGMDSAAYAGIPLLMAASIWNAWRSPGGRHPEQGEHPRRRAHRLLAS